MPHNRLSTIEVPVHLKSSGAMGLAQVPKELRRAPPELSPLRLIVPFSLYLSQDGLHSSGAPAIFSATKRTIIHGAVTVAGESAQVVNGGFDEARFPGAAHDAVIERTHEEFRKNCDEVETHWLAG